VIVLDATTRSLEVLLGGAVAASQLPVVATYVDVTTSTYLPGSSNTVTNNSTAVTAAAAPAAATQRQVKLLSVYNADSAAVALTVRYNDNGTARKILTSTLQAGESLLYTDGEGFRALDANGAVKHAWTGYQLARGTGFAQVNSDGSVEISPASGTNTTFDGGDVVLPSAGALRWSTDCVLRRGGAGILSQRNGASAQESRVYNTYTDASNGEWGALRWNASVLEVGTYANGTGAQRNLALVAANSVAATMSANTTASFILTNALAGAAAQTQFKAANDLGHLAYQGVTSSTFSSAGALATDTAFWLSFGCPALYGSQSAQPVIWCQSLTEIARIDTGGQWQIALKTKAGTPADADFVTPASGMIAVDTTASKIWVRVGSTWKSVAVT
jgi:hypothetical protein